MENDREPNLRLVAGDVTGSIIAAFYAVYDSLGFGFLESVYRNALAFELEDRGLRVAREAPIDVWLKGRKMGHFRADLLVGNAVIAEVKASYQPDPTARKQLANYLRATSVEVGLVLHFGQQASFQRAYFSNARKRGRPSPNDT